MKVPTTRGSLLITNVHWTCMQRACIHWSNKEWCALCNRHTLCRQNRLHDMIRSTRKPTLCTLRNVSTKIRLHSSHRLIRADIFRIRGIDVQSNDSWNRKSTGGVNCLSRLACAACLGWSGSILNAQSPRKVHIVGFLAGRLIWYSYSLLNL